VLGNVEMSLPGAVYGVLMFFIAGAFGFVTARTGQRASLSTTAP